MAPRLVQNLQMLRTCGRAQFNSLFTASTNKITVLKLNHINIVFVLFLFSSFVCVCFWHTFYSIRCVFLNPRSGKNWNRFQTCVKYQRFKNRNLYIILFRKFFYIFLVIFHNEFAFQLVIDDAFPSVLYKIVRWNCA